jgi:hypothetical protein
MIVPNRAWQMHGEFFGFSGEKVVLVHYAGLLMTKIGIFALFLFPCIGIKFVQRKRNRKPSNNGYIMKG